MTRLVLSMWEPWAILTVVPDPLTGRPPKGVESRHFWPSAQTPFDVVIHATKTWNRLIADHVIGDPIIVQALTAIGYHADDPRPYLRTGLRPRSGRVPLPLGALVGVATVTRIATADALRNEWARDTRDHGDDWPREFYLGDYTVGRFGWVLEKAAPLSKPIPFLGKQTVLYPLLPFYEEQVDAQLAAVMP